MQDCISARCHWHSSMEEIEPDDVEGKLRQLLRLAQAGELTGAVAIRVFHRDGTHEDIAFGGTVEDQQRAIATLQAKFEQKH